MRANQTRLQAYFDTHSEKVYLLFILFLKICLIIPITIIIAICYVILMIIWRIFLIISTYLLDKR